MHQEVTQGCTIAAQLQRLQQQQRHGQGDGGMIVMSNSGGDGRRRVSRRETATAAADCIGKQQWQLNWWQDGNTIAMAITMNAGGGDGRWQWRWRNLDWLWSLQHNGWWDGGAIVMTLGNGREKATQWKMVMVAAQS